MYVCVDADKHRLQLIANVLRTKLTHLPSIGNCYS